MKDSFKSVIKNQSISNSDPDKYNSDRFQKKNISRQNQNIPQSNISSQKSSYGEYSENYKKSLTSLDKEI